MDSGEQEEGVLDTQGEERARPLVLVVEDDPSDWHLYGELLWYNGFDVARATEGREALRIAGERTPDLVLLDLVLPGMDGLEVCRRMRADPVLRAVPVVVLTGRSAADVEGSCLEAGANRFLQKPASPLAVLGLVEELIGRPPLPGAEGGWEWRAS